MSRSPSESKSTDSSWEKILVAAIPGAIVAVGMALMERIYKLLAQVSTPVGLACVGLGFLSLIFLLIRKPWHWKRHMQIISIGSSTAAVIFGVTLLVPTGQTNSPPNPPLPSQSPVTTTGPMPTPTSTPIPTLSSPTLTKVTATSPIAFLAPVPGSIHHTIQVGNMSGNVSLAGHILHVKENGEPLRVMSNVGDLVDAGTGIRISSATVEHLEIQTSNNTGQVGSVVVTIDELTVFTCPPLSDPNNRQVQCILS